MRCASIFLPLFWHSSDITLISSWMCHWFSPSAFPCPAEETDSLSGPHHLWPPEQTPEALSTAELGRRLSLSPCRLPQWGFDPILLRPLGFPCAIQNYCGLCSKEVTFLDVSLCFFFFVQFHSSHLEIRLTYGTQYLFWEPFSFWWVWYCQNPSTNKIPMAQDWVFQNNF